MALLTDSILPLIFVFFFLFCFAKSKRLQVEGLKPVWIQLLFLLKCCFGLLLWWIYTYYDAYQGASDSFLYFEDAMILSALAETNPQHFFQLLLGVGIEDPSLTVYFDDMHRWWCKYTYGIANDYPSIIRINALIGLVSFGSFHVHTVFMCFISTLAGILLLKALKSIVQIPIKALFLLVLFLPSYLFWTSGVLKEAPLMFGLALFIFSFFKISKAGFKAFVYFIPLFFGAWLLWYIKGYVLLSLVPALLFWVLSERVKWWRMVFFGVHGLALIAAVFADVFYPAGKFLYVLGKKQTDFINVANKQDAGSLIEAIPITDWPNFISHLPEYWITTFFRPFLGEGDSLLQHLCSVESFLCLFLLILALILRREQTRDEGRLMMFSISFLMVLGAIIGATVPVLGAVVRYKVPLLPFFGLLIALLIDDRFLWRKMKTLRSKIMKEV